MSHPNEKALLKFREYYDHENIIEYTPDESRLMDAFQQCINCGLCMAVCETLEELMTADGQYCGPRDIGIRLSRSVPDFWATTDTIYYCTMCGACEAVCPKQVPIPEIVAMIRNKIPRQVGGNVPVAHAMIRENLHEAGNIYGEKIEPLEYRREKAEYVFFEGCVGTWLERDSVEATLQLLDRLGVKFTTIDEVCCGGPTKVAGWPMDISLVDHNLEHILDTGTNKVITACPRCFMTLAYHPAYAGKLQVQHTSQFLAQFDWSALTDRPVTFHDPCELGRHLGEYDNPRQILRKAFPNYREMDLNKESTYCCGAGGGLRGVYPRVSLQMARSRLEQAMSTDSQVLLTECASCLHNFRNGLRSRDNLEVFNLSEYLNSLLQITNGCPQMIKESTNHDR